MERTSRVKKLRSLFKTRDRYRPHRLKNEKNHSALTSAVEPQSSL